MQPDDPNNLLDQAITSAGRDVVISALKEMIGQKAASLDTLTVIGNAGVHKIPAEYLRGDIYEVSQGSWSIQSAEQLNRLFSDLLVSLVAKLQERTWRKIYFIPTGHPILSIQIKTLIYRVLRQNTVDLYQHNGIYFEIEIDHRQIALNASSKDKIPGDKAI